MDPSLLIALIERLPDTSMTTALAAGGKQMFGWGLDRYMLADVYDALNLNTVATGNFTKRPKLPSYPRPKSTKKAKSDLEKRRPIGIKQLYQQFLTRSQKQSEGR